MENKFYTAEPKFKRVTKEEFIKFLESYPRRLERDVCGICDPPVVSYNDWELANKRPYSIIASTMLYSEDPNDYWYEPPEERIYGILENYEEVFNSKTGYQETY